MLNKYFTDYFTDFNEDWLKGRNAPSKFAYS
jgi:hypothetical protein